MSHKVNTQRTIVKRYLNNIFNMKNSVSVKTPGVHFALKISATQRFGTRA